MIKNFLNGFINKNPSFMPHIDGLRAIAVLMVLLFHLDVSFIKGGFIGVDIFFVISGFLITKIIATEISEHRFSFINFYARRIKRIFPALFSVLFFSSLAAILFLGLTQYGDFFKALRMASGQISNIFFSKDVDYFDIGHDHSPLLHTWSLGVEEQFYIIWPILLLALHKFIGLEKGLIFFAILICASLGISEYLLHTNPMHSFYLLHARAWELAIGGIVALYGSKITLSPLQSKILSITGLVTIAVTACFYTEGSFPGIKAAAPVIATAFVILSAQHHTSFAHKFLSSMPLLFIGAISYSLYLWHWPLIAFYKSYFNDHLDIMTQILIFTLSIIIAALSYIFIEKPFRHSSFKPKYVVIFGVITMVIFIGASNIAKHWNDAPWRLLYNVGEDVRKPHPLDKICSINGGAYNKDKCIIGPNKDKYEVILSGDSHASHYTYTVLEWAKSRGLTVRIFLRGACRTWLITDEPRLRDGKPDPYCAQLSNDFYKTLNTDKSIQYVFLGLLRPQLNDDMKHSLSEIAKHNKKTYFLGQPPMFRENPHECQIKNFLLISRIFPLKNQNKNCLDLDIVWSNKELSPDRDQLTAYLKEKGIYYFNPTPFVKTGFDDKGQFMYLDQNHLNIYGSLYFAPFLKDFIEGNEKK